MTITATQYLFKAVALTATTSATSIGGYVVPALMVAQVVAVTISNSATSNITNYVTAGIFDGTNTYPVSGVKTPVYPGGSFVVVGAEKHILPSGGSFQVIPYATTPLSVVMSLVELKQ